MKSTTAVQAGLLSLVIVATSAVAPQQKASPPAKGGAVSGRVLAITNGGDLKPAKLAEIHLFYAHRPTTAIDPSNESNTSGQAWIENERKAMDD